MIVAGLGRSQEPGTTSAAPKREAGIQAFRLVSTAFQGLLAGSWIEIREAGYKPVLIGDAGNTGDSFMCNATIPAPRT